MHPAFEILFRSGVLRGRACLAILLAASVIGQARAAAEGYRWVAIPIEVTNLPPNCSFVPFSLPLDLTSLLRTLEMTNAPDTHLLRLVRLLPDGHTAEEPYQFTPAEQPRVKDRKLLPGTTKNTSYVAEYAAGEEPAVKTTGTLAWILRYRDSSRVRYRLEVGSPRAGRVIQVPYAPQDLHSFSDTGRATSPRWFPRMQIQPQQPIDGGVSVLRDRELFAKYYTGPLFGITNAAVPFRRPFLYPVNGPDGVSLTGFGKPHDPTGSHNHHYSLWVAHNSVNGLDFWSERAGIIAHEQFQELEDGPLYSRIRQKTRWMFGSTNLLRETRTTTFYAADDFRLIDLTIALAPAGSNVITFGKTSFGFLAARVAPSLSPFDGGGEIVNANGERNEQSVHLRKAAWLDQSGPIAQDKWGGLAILDHPDNPGFPTVWHCRNDGWAGAAFNAEQPYTLEPGRMLELRYRVVLHRNDAAHGNVAARFQEWIARPAAHIGQAESMRKEDGSDPLRPGPSSK